MLHDAAVGSRVPRWFVRAGAIAAVLLAAHGAASAGPDDERGNLAESLDVWKRVDGKFQLDLRARKSQFRTCEDVLRLQYEHTPETETFTLKQDKPGLKAGTHPWPAARAACDAIIAAATVAERVEKFALWAHSAKQMADQGKQRDDNTLKWCLSTYDEAVKLGASPTELVTYYELNMTMQEARAFCADRKGKLDSVEEARVAPYKKLLKNDKLSMAINHTDYLFMPGGVELTPQRAARFNVWFKDVVPERRCTDGRELHVLHRYQFNARQEMVKVTDREFCGAPPASAFR